MYRSEKLCNTVDKIIPDSKIYPICIPSYGRPDAKLLQSLSKQDLPVILFIRKEQYDIYEKYKDVFKIVKLIGVNNIGQTRHKIVQYCIYKKIPKIFMLDDDINLCDFILPSVTSGGHKALRPYCTHKGTPYRINKHFFKMWMWYLSKADKKVAISSAGRKRDWWGMQYANAQPIYNSGSVIQCVCLNIKLLHKYDINYIDSDVCGIEDYAIQYHCMKSGLYTLIIKDLVYDCPTMGKNIGGCDYSEGVTETLNKRMKLFMENVVSEEDKKYMTTKITRSGIPSIRFKWNHFRVKEEDEVW